MLSSLTCAGELHPQPKSLKELVPALQRAAACRLPPPGRRFLLRPQLAGHSCKPIVGPNRPTVDHRLLLLLLLLTGPPPNPGPTLSHDLLDLLFRPEEVIRSTLPVIDGSYPS